MVWNKIKTQVFIITPQEHCKSMDDKGHRIKLKSYDSKQTFFILNKYKLDIDCKILKIEWRG